MLDSDLRRRRMKTLTGEPGSNFYNWTYHVRLFRGLKKNNGLFIIPQCYKIAIIPVKLPPVWLSSFCWQLGWTNLVHSVLIDPDPNRFWPRLAGFTRNIISCHRVQDSPWRYGRKCSFQFPYLTPYSNPKLHYYREMLLSIDWKVIKEN